MNSALSPNNIYFVATNTTASLGSLQTNNATLTFDEPFWRADGTILPQGEPTNGTQLATTTLTVQLVISLTTKVLPPSLPLLLPVVHLSNAKIPVHFQLLSEATESNIEKDAVH
jgi:hypothetical protein